MELRDITYEGPSLDNQELLARLPSDYHHLLEQINGFIQFYGGLHIRGICIEPRWHSLAEVWFGEFALSRLYPSIRPTDIPFGQDVVGDQFVLRDQVVHRLSAETGEVNSLECSLLEFLERAQGDPLEYLSLEPMIQFYNEGGTLTPGQLISVYPPFCAQESGGSISLRAVPTLERIGFLAELAQQVARIPDGTQVRFQAVRLTDGEQGKHEVS